MPQFLPTAKHLYTHENPKYDRVHRFCFAMWLKRVPLLNIVAPKQGRLTVNLHLPGLMRYFASTVV